MNKLSEKKVKEILLIEDNPADVRLMTEVLKDINIEKNITVLEDGEKVMDYLLKNGQFVNAKRPDIILLDLNIPKKDGFKILEEIKTSNALKTIPVIVISTSNSQENIRQAYMLHANCYFVKPFQLDEFIRIIRSIEEFWLNLVTLP
jgi:CheY-like chemotaxis protein